LGSGTGTGTVVDNDPELAELAEVVVAAAAEDGVVGAIEAAGDIVDVVAVRGVVVVVGTVVAAGDVVAAVAEPPG